MWTRDHALFNEIYRICKVELGYSTYDYKPLDEIPYPFVELESSQTLFNANKTDVKGTVDIVISVWGLQTKRKEVSDMAGKIIEKCSRITTAKGYRWSLDYAGSLFELMDDTSTNTPLKRARLSLSFNLN